VTLPPGRARLATRPVRTGSPAAAKTIGMVEVAGERGIFRQSRAAANHVYG
jgi:hypothetical protein